MFDSFLSFFLWGDIKFDIQYLGSLYFIYAVHFLELQFMQE